MRPRAGIVVVWPKLKALGHPIRAEIVALVVASPTAPCASDLEEHFAIAQPTLSHHLHILQKTGVLQAEKRGLRVHYAIDRGLVDALSKLLRALK
jgi:ArsR family transcriptional regulator, arsenate/arsenite/antimonite-responsive transcriptional repressor